ncbi:MFS general substrate transporter [Exidia glandulosa HHB12029]|uniref:MFS general substrate transporter n=1 Tax=Exidia glandulosa HHB12029 TaxID=1314781 RepID=A0A165EW11_EXIGL|nr:MFS general substrate transporter [Exidia glandulosa HHB12029]
MDIAVQRADEHERSSTGGPPSRDHDDDALQTTAADDEPVKELGWKWFARLGGALFLPTFLETLDVTVVATAQPHIASAFGRLDLQSYIGTTYILTSTVFLPLFASFADIFGRHSSLQFALILFLIGSAISTGAPNMGTMLAGRSISGIGAAGLLAVVRVILADERSIKTQNTTTAFLFVFKAIGFVVGPVIGGALSTQSFRWIFAINLPMCLVSMVLLWVLLRGRVRKQNDFVPPRAFHSGNKSLTSKLERIDILGATIFVTAGVLFLLGLNWGSTLAWGDARVVTTLVLSAALFGVFGWWEYVLWKYTDVEWPPSWARADPMIPLAIFKSMDVCITEYAVYVTGMIMVVVFYFLAIFFSVANGLDATSAGVQLLYFAPGLGGGSQASVVIVRRWQPRYAIILGQTVMTVGVGLLAWAIGRNDQLAIKLTLVLTGLGVGLSVGPSSIQARFSVLERFSAVVISLNLFFQSLGGTVGIAQCSAVLNSRVRSFITDLFSSGAISPSDALQLGRVAQGSLEGISALPDELQEHVRDAFRDGTRWAFLSLLPWLGVSALVVLLLKRVEDPTRVKRDVEMTSLPEQREEGARPTGS